MSSRLRVRAGRESSGSAFARRSSSTTSAVHPCMTAANSGVGPPKPSRLFALALACSKMRTVRASPPEEYRDEWQPLRPAVPGRRLHGRPARQVEGSSLAPPATGQADRPAARLRSAGFRTTPPTPTALGNRAFSSARTGTHREAVHVPLRRRTARSRSRWPPSGPGARSARQTRPRSLPSDASPAIQSRRRFRPAARRPTHRPPTCSWRPARRAALRIGDGEHEHGALGSSEHKRLQKKCAAHTTTLEILPSARILRRTCTNSLLHVYRLFSTSHGRSGSYLPGHCRRAGAWLLPPCPPPTGRAVGLCTGLQASMAYQRYP